jgi:hypothetical protein
MTPKWEVKIVENAGEIKGEVNSEKVVVPTSALITDIKSQLMFIPKQFSWTVGWRAYVWQEKETGKFQELTEDEWSELGAVGTVGYSRDDSGSDTPSGDAREDEGSSTE